MVNNKIDSVKFNNFINSIKKEQRVNKAFSGKEGYRNSKFANILSEKLFDIKFSKHAVEQMEKRGIEINNVTFSKISKGIEVTGSKGGKEALFIIDNNGFVVSVKNRVVITAFGKEDLKDNIVTNIDSVYFS